MPEETSGYVSGTGLSTTGMSPVVVQNMEKELRYGESTPLRSSLGVTQAEYTPRGSAIEELQSFLLSPSEVEQKRNKSNLSPESRDRVTQKALHSELLSFATRPVEAGENSLLGNKETPAVGPWPYKRDTKMIVDNARERVRTTMSSAKHNPRPI